MAENNPEQDVERPKEASAKAVGVDAGEVKSLQDGAAQQAVERKEFLKGSYRRPSSSSTEFVFAVLDKLGQASLTIYDGAKKVVGALTGEIPKLATETCRAVEQKAEELAEVLDDPEQSDLAPRKHSVSKGSDTPRESHLTRDKQGRITHIEYPNGKACDVAYDAAGHLVKVTRAGETWTRTDKGWNVQLAGGPELAKPEVDIKDIGNGTLRWTYPDSQFYAMPDGTTVEASPDRSSVSRDDMGRPERVDYPDGRTTALQYEDGHLAVIKNSEDVTWRREGQEWKLYDRQGDVLDHSQMLAEVDSKTGTIKFIDTTGSGSVTEFHRDGRVESYTPTADAKPADTKPADAKAADAKSADAKPSDLRPADAKPPVAEAPLAKKPGTHGSEDGSLISVDDNGRVTLMVTPQGTWHQFKYGADGKVNEVQDPTARWTTDDGQHWVNAKGEKWEGTINVTGDGRYQFSDLNGEVNVSRNPNGSEITTDKDGNVIKSKYPNGEQYEFKYELDADGKPKIYEVKEKDKTWTTHDGQLWVDGKGGTWEGTVNVTADGRYQFTENRNGAPVTLTKNFDGSRTVVNREGQAVATKDAAGKEHTFKYGAGPDGKPMVVEMKDSSGTWTTKDGKTWLQHDVRWVDNQEVKSTDQWKGTVKVTEDGTLIRTDAKGETRDQLDGRQIHTNQDRSGYVINRFGEVEKTIDVGGNTRTFHHGLDGKLNTVTEPDGTTWQTKDGTTWATKDGKEWKGNISVDKKGAYHYTDLNGTETIKKLDATTLVKETSGRITETDRNGKLRETQQAVDEAKIKGLVKALHKESGAEASVKALSHTDREKVFNILRDTNQAERQQLELMYQESYHKSLEQEYSFLTGSDRDKFKSLLHREDGDDVQRRSDLIKARISELHEFTGDSRKAGEEAIRKALLTSNSEDISEMDSYYRKNYNVGLREAIQNDSKISEATKLMCATYMKGADKLSDDDFLKLADVALKERRIDLFQEVLTSNSMSPEARKKFMDEGGQKRLEDAFGSKWYDYIPHVAIYGRIAGAVVDRKLVGNLTDTDLRHATDFGEHGKLSTANQIRDNLGIVNDNEKAIDQALSRMPDQERREFVRGKELAINDEKPLTDSDKKAAATYQELHEVLLKAAGSNVSELSAWEDRITHKDGSLVARLAAHKGVVLNDGRGSVLNDIENMNEQDWKYIKAHPEYRDEVKKVLKDLNGTVTGVKTSDIAKALDLYDKKVDAKTFEESQAVRRSLAEALEDSKSVLRHDRKAMLESISHMSPKEQKDYREDAYFQQKVDKAIDECFKHEVGIKQVDRLHGQVTDEPGLYAAKHMLERIKQGEDPNDLISKLYTRAQERRDTDVNVAAGTLASSVVTFGVLAVEAGVDTATGSHARDALFGKQAADAVRDIQQEFQKHPELRERILHPKTADDQELSKHFNKAAHATMTDADFDRYVKPLLEKGYISADRLAEISQSFLKNDIAGQFQDLSRLPAEEREKILNKRSYQDKVLGNLSDEDRKVAINAIKQGKMEPEDAIRHHINHWGGSAEVMRELRNMTPAQLDKSRRDYATKYGSDLENDLLGKLSAEERREFIQQHRTYTNLDKHDNAVADKLRSRDGFGNWLVETVGRSGVGYQLDDVASQYTREIADAQANFKQMPPEQQRELENQLRESLKNWKETKEAAAEYTTDAAIAAAGIASLILTGGADAPVLATMLAGAGATMKVAGKAAIMGADYDGSASQVAKDAAVGALSGATSVLGPEHIAGAFRVGHQAALKAANAAAKELGTKAGQQLLKEGAEKVLEDGAKDIMKKALAHGAKDIDKKAIMDLAGKAIPNELTGAAKEQATKQVAETLERNLRQSFQKETESWLNNLGREAALNAGAGGAGGAASGIVDGAAKWDGTKSVMQNLATIGESMALGAGSGGAGAVGITAVLKVGTPAYEAVVSRFHLKGGQPATGEQVAAIGDATHLKNPTVITDKDGSIRISGLPEQAGIPHAGDRPAMLPPEPKADVKPGVNDVPPTQPAPQKHDELMPPTQRSPHRRDEHVSPPEHPKVKHEDTMPPTERPPVSDKRPLPANSGDVSASKFKIDDSGKRMEFPLDNGQPVQLQEKDGWWYPENFKHQETDRSAKLRVLAADSKDLGKVQKILLEEMKRDPELANLMADFKMQDPRLADPAYAEQAGKKVGQGQEQKAITIGAKNPEDLAKLQKKLDAMYAHHPELSEKPIIPGGTDKVVGESGRVAIARDFYPGTADPAGHAGAKLDPELAERIHADPSLEHAPADGRLTDKGLRQAEKEAGLKEGTLSYDKQNNLMLKASDAHDPVDAKKIGAFAERIGVGAPGDRGKYSPQQLRQIEQRAGMKEGQLRYEGDVLMQTKPPETDKGMVYLPEVGANKVPRGEIDPQTGKPSTGLEDRYAYNKLSEKYGISPIDGTPLPEKSSSKSISPDKPDANQAAIRDGQINSDNAKELQKGGSRHRAYEVDVQQPDGTTKKAVFHADEFGDSEVRLRNDKAAYKLNQLVGLENGFPATVEREVRVPAPNEVKAAADFDPAFQKFKGADGKLNDEGLRKLEQQSGLEKGSLSYSEGGQMVQNTKGWAQEYVGEDFRSGLEQLAKERYGDSSPEAIEKLMKEVPKVNKAIETAMVERMLVGDVDFRDSNFRLVRGADGEVTVKNIDLDFAFKDNKVPEVKMPGEVGITRQLAEGLSDQPLSPELREKISNFVQQYDNPAGRADLGKMGLKPDEVDAYLARAQHMADTGKFSHVEQKGASVPQRPRDTVPSPSRAEGSRAAVDGSITHPADAPTRAKSAQEFEPSLETASMAARQLSRALEHAGLHPEQERQFRADLGEIDKLPEAQQKRIYDSLERVANSKEPIDLTQTQRLEVVKSLAHQIAHPESIQQGCHESCALASAEAVMVRQHPEMYAEMVSALATEGSYKTPGGRVVVAEGAEANRLDPKSDAYGRRSYASELFQDAAGQLAFNPPKTYRSYPPDSPQAHPRPAGVTPADDTGERIIDINHPEKSPARFTGLEPDQKAKVMSSLTGEKYRSIEPIETAQALAGALSKNGGPPMSVGIHLGSARDFLANNDEAGALSGYHAVTITKVEKGQDGKELVYFDNAAGGRNHSYPQGEGVPIDKFVQAMSGGQFKKGAIIRDD